MSGLKIVFMGSPDFAVDSLSALLASEHKVVAVVTATDKWGGRGGKQLLTTEVKKFAMDKGIPVLQPSNLKALSFIDELKSYEHDLQVVVAFRMLPQVVWDLPKLGTINVHASLLPRYRGAAPINWAIIKGEKETGVTVFKLQHEIDTGGIVRQKSIPIENSDDFGSLYTKLKRLGAEELMLAIKDIADGSARYLPQNDALACHAPKIYHETCQIDFNNTAKNVQNFVRGLHPFPSAWFEFMGQEMKVLRCDILQLQHSYKPGSIQSDKKKYLHIATTDGFLILQKVKYEGKKEMEIADFLNGFHWTE